MKLWENFWLDIRFGCPKAGKQKKGRESLSLFDPKGLRALGSRVEAGDADVDADANANVSASARRDQYA